MINFPLHSIASMNILERKHIIFPSSRQDRCSVGPGNEALVLAAF